MEKPLIATIEYTHNCICSDVPERHPDTSIKYLAELGDDGKNISHLFSVKGGDVHSFLESMRVHPTASDVRAIRKTEDGADVITVTRKEASTSHALKEAKCAFISSPVYGGGIEKVKIFAPSFNALRHFLDALKDSYNVRIVSKHFMKDKEKITPELLVKSGYLELMQATETLTERQIEALNLACSMGYYDMPKKKAITDIADKMGIGESAASELLRKVEKKLLPTLAKIVELQK